MVGQTLAKRYEHRQATCRSHRYAGESCREAVKCPGEAECSDRSILLGEDRAGPGQRWITVKIL